MASPSLYQPSPRLGHCAAQVGEKAYLWGGRTQNFSVSGQKSLASELSTFDAFSETWNTRPTTGVPPLGLYDGGCTVIDNSLYYFGGRDGHSYYNSLHCINSITAEWKELSSLNPVNQPVPKIGFGIVTYTETASLAIFAGYCVTHQPTQAGASFIESTNYTGFGWTNEFHLFNLTNGEWTSPTITGARPPPCAGFSFTAINHHKAVMFGGNDQKHRFNDVYIIDFHSMVWTKLERPEGATWPVERSYHAATCLNYGDDHPQLLVTGGVDKNLKTLNDGWLLDVNTGTWRELTLPEGTQPRWGHTLTACSVCPGRVHTTTFGGIPEGQLGKPEDAKQKLAETTVMEFESVQSGVSSPANEWVLVGTITTSELGTPERVAQLEKMKQRKTDHGDQFQPQVAAGPLMISGFPTQLPAMQPTLPRLHQSTTLPVHTPTFQIYHPAQFPVPPTVPTLQPPYSGGRFQEMFPEQLPSIPPIEPALFPYHAQPHMPRSTVLHSKQSEFHPVVRSTPAHQVEGSIAAAPSLQHSTPIGPLDTLWTTVPATSPHTTYTDTPLQESLLPRRTSQTVDKPKFEQLPPMEKKPSLPDIKLKMEFSPKKEPGAIKTELKWEVEEDVKPKWEVEEDVKPKWEVEEDVKPKQVFSVSDFEKGDLIEQLTAKNKLLLETISRLKEHIAEKDVYKAAGVIAGKRKQLEASEEGVVLKKQRLSDEASGESAVEVGREDKPGIGETDSSVKVQIKALEAEIEELKRQLSQKKSKTSYNSLLGVEVVGEEEVVVTNEAMNFHWKDYGFKLHVPENALPEGTPEYHVNIKASLSGQFELPEGYELVSAVYWVATPGKFTKPVKIEAQHCANFSNPSQLCFVRTNCTQKSLPYKFKIVDGGSFTYGSKYGVLSAPHFSGNGMAKKVTPGEHSCQYCAQVYFTVKHLQDHWYYCHFVVIKDLEMCLTVVKRKYHQEYDIARPITFGGDHVELAIPDDGTRTDNGWEIKPLHNPCIKKDSVNNFSSESTWVPECVLLLKWLLKDKHPEPLEYKVKLLGTGDDNDFFVIVHHPGSQPSLSTPTVQPNRPATMEGPQVELNGQTGSTPQLKDLMNALYHKVADKWKMIGIHLIIPKGKLAGITEKYPHDPHRCLVEMLEIWLEQVHPPPTWTAIIEAVEFLGEGQLGKELREKYTVN